MASEETVVFQTDKSYSNCHTVAQRQTLDNDRLQNLTENRVTDNLVFLYRMVHIQNLAPKSAGII